MYKSPAYDARQIIIWMHPSQSLKIFYTKITLFILVLHVLWCLWKQLYVLYQIYFLVTKFNVFLVAYFYINNEILHRWWIYNLYTRLKRNFAWGLNLKSFIENIINRTCTHGMVKLSLNKNLIENTINCPVYLKIFRDILCLQL